jgi:broad specificity phosphatase PhoE
LHYPNHVPRTLIHLVRHAEVENPNNIWYGRLEGFVLSERGKRQTEALAEYFSGRPIEGIYSSPLTRALQTASPIAERLGLELQIDEDLIEAEARLQGRPGDVRVLRNPLNARYFLNPLRPSWGEAYKSIRARMEEAITRMRSTHDGGEAVGVSHETPLLVARLWYEKNPRPPWRVKIPCERASVTTLEFEDDRYVATEYLPLGSSIS